MQLAQRGNACIGRSTRRTAQMSAFGLGHAPIDTLCSTARELAELNTRVRRVYDRAFRIGDVMCGAQGHNKLRGYASVVARLLRSEIHRYEQMFAGGTLPETQMALKPDALRTMRAIVERLVVAHGTDKATRINQLGVFLAAIVIEKGIAQSLLPPPPPVAASGAVDAGADSAHSVAYLERRAAVLFFTRSLKAHFSRLLDGSDDLYESLDTFVHECAADYHEYQPAYLPVELVDCE